MADIGLDIKRAVNLLSKGELVAIPTETVYGLAGNALDADACIKIFEAKDRPSFDPLIVHISGIEEVPKYAKVFPDNAKKLCEALWPGPLTIVLPKKDNIPDVVTAGKDSVALRVPNHPMTLQLLAALDFPLAAPSANPFGFISPTQALHVNQQLGDKIKYILDGGPCEVGLESTIVSFTGEKPRLLRLGGMDPEILRAHLGDMDESLSQHSNPDAPGQMDKHYSPKTQFELIELGSDYPESAGIGFLRFHKPLENVPIINQFFLASNGDLHTAARNLFRLLRKLDGMKFSKIVAERVPDHGLGRAINDRLTRAAAGSTSPE